MPEIQEFKLQGPDMMRDRFFIEKKGKGFQDWDRQFHDGSTLEFFYEGEDVWLPATVDSWFIDDGSGNAPGANAHFFLRIRRNGKTYKMDLYQDMLIRVEAPSDDELRQGMKTCEALVTVQDATRYNAPIYGVCDSEAIRYEHENGSESWYCEKHKPAWIEVKV